MEIECHRITGALGAEVTGVDLADPSPSMIDELEIHPFATSHREYPEIVRITSSEKHPYAASSWHADVTWRQEPSMGSILRGVVIPPVGGDTSFADSALAHERLPDDVEDVIDGRFAIHDFSMSFGRAMTDEERAEQQARFPPARHPMVRTHPETEARSLSTSRNFVREIEGFDDPAEFDRLMDAFDRAMDNRAVHHHAADDFWPETRHVECVTICGDRPF